MTTSGESAKLFVEHSMGISGGGEAPAGPGGGSSKKMADYLKGINNTTRKSLGATLGIKLGTASILKQSQVFTGFMGTIFQLMGALVDVILAPFLPILIPGIKLMAQMIPYVAKYSQAVFDFLNATLFEWLRNAMGKFPGNLTGKLIPALSAILVGVFFLKMSGLWSPVMKLISGFIGKPLWELISSKLGWLTGKLLGFPDDFVKAFGLKFMLKETLKTALNTVRTKLTSFIRTQFTMRMNTLKGLFTLVKGYIDEPLKFIRGKVGGLATFLARPFAGLWDNIASKLFNPLATHMDNFAIRFLGSAKTWITELPVVKGAIKFFGLKGALGKVGGFLGRGAKFAAGKSGTALKVLGTSMKGVPVLGSVAELGFGAYQTYQDYQKYGAKEAMMRGALTLGNATTAFFDPTGVASAAGSIGSNIAMSQVFKNNELNKGWAEKNKELVIRVQDGNDWKYYDKKHFDTTDHIVDTEPGMGYAGSYRPTIENR
mgnify:CR=1 FL=1